MLHTTLELNKIHCGDALEVLQTLPSGSANCIVTSPPYYALRDYGVAGQIGGEQTPELYIDALVGVFMECHRVLRADGTMWVVIGDSYANSGRGWGGKNDLYSRKVQPLASFAAKFTKPHKISGYKCKDLIGIPWMLALELRRRGWYLRQDIIWHKPNPMPESVRDRCTKAHEYVFLLTKSPKYWFDHEATLEPAAYDGRKKMTHGGSKKYAENTATVSKMEIVAQSIFKGGAQRWPNTIGYSVKDGSTGLRPQHHGVNICVDRPARNRRSVWTVPTCPFRGTHFATFPPALISTCIAAGCPPGGVVLDPFVGAGTTAMVALELGRNYVGIELNPEYIKIAEGRVREMD
jgi:DNA modification methylase